MKAAVTQWFPPDQPPVRVGAYQRDYSGSNTGILYPDYWDGKRWHMKLDGMNYSSLPASARPWRGLASDPSKVGAA